MDNKNDKLLGKLYDMLVREDILKIVQDEKEAHLAIRVERLNKYLDKLKRVQDMMLEKDKLDVLKKMYYNKYIIKEEDIPDSYLKSLEKRYLDDGYGHVNLVNPVTVLDKELRKQHVDLIISEQKSSLDTWLDYLLSSDSDYLEMWAKVWVFQGMLKIGNYDVNKNSYGRRSKVTINPFVSFDSEIMGKCVDLVKQNLDGGAPIERELDKLVESGNFAKLYGMMLANKKKINISSNDGIWIKYNYETEAEVLQKEHDGIEPEYLKLYNSLQRYNTGWCTASSKETAKSQICGSSNYEGGDFYVYYSIDENGEYKIPRIAIRMDRDRIGEIRGISENQNIESGIEDILEEKLKEFPDAEKYKKKVSDMKILTRIYYKNKERIELTREELRFLYEIDGKITAFGYKKDPRIKEIKLSRNKKSDLAFALECTENDIGIEESDLKRELFYYDSNIQVYEFSSERFFFPRIVSGDLSMYYFSNLDNFNVMFVGGNLELHSNGISCLKLPEHVGGDVRLIRQSSYEQLILPKHIGGSLIFKSLTNSYGVNFPSRLEKNLILDALIKARGLQLPEYIGGNLSLNSLTKIWGIKLPEYIGGNLSLNSLTKIWGIKLPEYIGGDLSLNGLTSSIGLKLPDYLGGSLYLQSLASAYGFRFPKSISGSLDLRGLKSSDFVTLPEYVGGDLRLSSLINASRVKFPKSVEGVLHLGGVTNAKGLVLPESIGELFLNGLKKAEGLKLPEDIKDFVCLSGLVSGEGLVLPKRIGYTLDLNGIANAADLKLPEHIDGSLYLNGLRSAIKLPNYIKKNLTLRGLMSLKGTKFPKYVGGNLDLISVFDANGAELPERVGGYLDLSSLPNVNNLKLPEYVDGDLNLMMLSSYNDIKWPKYIGGNVFLNSLSLSDVPKDLNCMGKIFCRENSRDLNDIDSLLDCERIRHLR